MRQLPAFLRVDVAKGYRWYTVGAGTENAPGWWLKLGPISVASYPLDGLSRLDVASFGRRPFLQTSACHGAYSVRVARGWLGVETSLRPWVTYYVSDRGRIRCWPKVAA